MANGQSSDLKYGMTSRHQSPRNEPTLFMRNPFRPAQ
jgi:hypothetical protein